MWYCACPNTNVVQWVHAIECEKCNTMTLSQTSMLHFFKHDDSAVSNMKLFCSDPEFYINKCNNKGERGWWREDIVRVYIRAPAWLTLRDTYLPSDLTDSYQRLTPTNLTALWISTDFFFKFPIFLFIPKLSISSAKVFRVMSSHQIIAPLVLFDFNQSNLSRDMTSILFSFCFLSRNLRAYTNVQKLTSMISTLTLKDL